MRLIPCLLLFALVGCSSASNYYRLEEWGEGWKLQVTEQKDRFKASWVKGDHRSVKLANYDDSRDNITLINTLYLELDKDGGVLNGRLKRIVASKFDRRTYDESHAQWFAVLSGRCLLDGEGKGRLDVKCQGGYEFSGEVLPASDLKLIKPETP